MTSPEGPVPSEADAGRNSSLSAAVLDDGVHTAWSRRWPLFAWAGAEDK